MLAGNSGMALNEYQQAHQYLGNSKNILVIAGHRDIEDTYPASLALLKVLKQNNKDTTLFSSGTIPENFYFLEGDKGPERAINGPRDIIISVDTSKGPVKQISYERTNSHLNIYITPNLGARIEEQDIHIGLAKFKYDLIVTLGLDDLGSLGEEFEHNASFFFETPIVNIDKNSSNERYGEVNIIEPTYSSCSEITSTLLKKWDEELITKEVATPLLCGIISTTNNFQNTRTKPNTLYEAAYLISREADQQEIIKRLFKTKSFEFLRLWGIAMAKLQYRQDLALSWLTLTKSDFAESGATPKTIPSVLKELKNNFAQSSCFVIFWENSTACFGIVNMLYDEQLKAVADSISGERRGNNILFSLPSKDKYDQDKIISCISRSLEQFKVQ